MTDAKCPFQPLVDRGYITAQEAEVARIVDQRKKVSKPIESLSEAKKLVKRPQ